MTRRIIAVASLAFAATACNKAEAPKASANPPFTGLTVADSFRTPESMLYDAAGDAYLVANINGGPGDKDDNGFISRVNPDGRVDQLKFIDGAGDSITLNAPKGMGIRGDTLFVADIDVVRLFDRANGRALGNWAVRGATFLNDLTVGPDGTVYVIDSGMHGNFSPSGTDAVYRFDAQGRAIAIARGASLGHPNGVAADSAGIVVNSFGTGEVYRFDAAGTRSAVPKPPAGQLDGMVIQPNGAMLVSSWADSSIWRLRRGDTTWVHVHQGIPSPADIGFDTRRGRILVPVFTANTIRVLPLH